MDLSGKDFPRSRNNVVSNSSVSSRDFGCKKKVLQYQHVQSKSCKYYFLVVVNVFPFNISPGVGLVAVEH